MNFNKQYSPPRPVFMTVQEYETALQEMEDDPSLDTKPALIKSDDNSFKLVSFFEKNSQYLKTHPKINPEHYIRNLKTTLRIRS